MNYHEFNTLDELDRADAAWKMGVLLMERREAFHKIVLYQLEGFYIEVVYHTHFNVILKVSTFKDPAHLDPYLSSISLPELFA